MGREDGHGLDVSKVMQKRVGDCKPLPDSASSTLLGSHSDTRGIRLKHFAFDS